MEEPGLARVLTTRRAHEGAMEEFVARENIRRFKAQLECSLDENQSAMLRKLLATEEQRLRTMLDAKGGQDEATQPTPGPLRKN